MNSYRFTNTKGGRAVLIIARTAAEAWRKLARTHEAYFHRDGWRLNQ